MHHTHTTVRSRNMDTNKGRSGTHTKILNNTLKRILQTPPSTPSEIIQIETGIWDIETMIEEKQIMYYDKIHNNRTGITKSTATKQKPMEHNHKKHTHQIQPGT